MQQHDVVVIGAGLGGLCAAWELKRQGLEPLVLEAAEQPGGRAAGCEEGGAIFDLGAWTFTRDSPAHAIARDMGLEHHLCDIRASVGRWHEGSIRTGRLDRPWTLPGNILPWRRIPHALNLRRLARRGPAGRDENAAQWAASHLPGDMARDLLAPLAGLYFLQDLESLSRNELLGTIAYLSEARLMGFRRGMGEWVRILAERVRPRCGSRVVSVEVAGYGMSVRCAGGGERVMARGVVLALPLPQTMALLATLAPESIPVTSRGKTCAATLAVRVLLKERWTRCALQVLPPYGRGKLCCGLAMERAKHGARVPDGYEAVTMYAAPGAFGELAAMDDRAVMDAFLRELAAWMGRDRLEPAAAGVARWPVAAALCDPGAADRAEILSRFLAELASDLPIWTAGDFLGSSSVSGAAETGVRAGRAASRRLARGGPGSAGV